VCPPHKRYWNGKACTQYGNFPIPTPPPSEIKCTGGRTQNSRGQCVCPSHKPQWTGRTCIPLVRTLPQPGPIRQLPGGNIQLIPGIKIQ
jgi:hypothetical protein